MKASMFALFGAVVVAGCGTVEFHNGERVRCSHRTVTVNHEAAYLRASPEIVDVCRGYTLSVRSVPPVGPEQLRTREDRGRNPEPAEWLDGESDTNGNIRLEVPANAASGVYKYDIEVQGVGRLDPRARVIP
jgi:hypothetical protein